MAERDCRLLAELIFNAILPKAMSVSSDRFFEIKDTGEHIGAIEYYINHHIHTKFTLSDVADYVHLGTKQVSRIIEKKYGMNFTDLLMNKRMTTAEMLLKNTNIPVAEIAAKSYPGTDSYFYILFKKRNGMSPLHYRKMMQKEEK